MIIDSLVKGGRERRLLELLKNFKQDKRIQTVLILFSKKIEYKEVYDVGIPIYFLERKPKKDPRVFARFYQICKREQPDLIHSWGTMPTIYAIPTAKFLGIKLLNATIADAPLKMGWSDDRYFRAKLTYPFSDFIVGNSEAGLKAYEAPTHKSQCIYNGLDFNRVNELEAPFAVRRKLKIKTEKVVGMIGGFFDRKDFITFVKSAELTLAQNPSITFLAIGDGPNLEQCKSIVKKEYKDRILFPGQLHDVESVINIFDVGVLSTNTFVHGEGISNSILEYMVLSKPVVATTGGGTNEIVVNEETGFLVNPADPQQMSDKIINLLDHPQEAFRMGINGELRVHQLFSLERMGKEYLALYERILDKTKTQKTSILQLNPSTVLRKHQNPTEPNSRNNNTIKH